MRKLADIKSYFTVVENSFLERILEGYESSVRKIVFLSEYQLIIGVKRMGG